MKKLLCLLLSLSLLFLLCACSGYPEIAQTEKESTVMAQMGDFNVTYDLYRAEFLTLKTAVDGGRASFWEGMTAEGKAAYYEEFSEGAMKSVARMLAVFALCREEGIDPYGRTANERVEKYFKESVDALGGEDPHSVYLKALRDTYLTDHVYRFLLRVQVCRGLFTEKLMEEGRLSITDKMAEMTDAIEEYFLSDETVAVIWMYRDVKNSSDSETQIRARMEGYRARLAEIEGIAAKRNFVGGYSNLMPFELENGRYLCRYETDEYDQALVDAAFSLEVGEASGVIASGDGLYVLLRVDKNINYLRDAAYENEFKEVYASHKIYGMIAQKADALLATVSHTEAYKALTLDDVVFE